MAKKDQDQKDTAGRAPAISDADDHAGSATYKDMPADDKPGPDSVAQVEVLEDDQS